MSYILDALKRADSEREREREDVPGLHSKTDPWIAPDEVRTSRQQPQAVVWALAVAGLLLVLGGLWFVLMREATPTAVPAAAVPAQPAPVMVAPAAVAPAALPQPVPAVGLPPAAPIAAPTPQPAPAARPAPVVPLPPRPARAAEPAALLPPAVAAPAKPKAEAQSSAGPTTASASASVPAAPAPTASAATSAEARLYTLNELPEDVRAGLPALAVGGAMYSQTPANRMLIINGQVFREGDTLAPGLVLEQIKLKSAVLKVKGLRYGIFY